MTNSKNILIDLLEKGFCVEITYKETGDVYTYYPIIWGGKYINGNAKYNTFSFGTGYVDTMDFTITKIYRQPIKPFKVGDSVNISEDIKKCDDYKDYIDTSMDFNNIYTIQYVDNELFGLNYGVKDKNLYFISHEYLIPVIDERKQVGDEIETEIEGEIRTVKIIK